MSKINEMCIVKSQHVDIQIFIFNLTHHLEF